ncbi:MAG TPA: hypothetical protein DDW42_00105 [Desulfobacteraceae bacterium]|nr:hypothetical protein [Desulfobacteraceae bacterium]
MSNRDDILGELWTINHIKSKGFGLFILSQRTITGNVWVNETAREDSLYREISKKLFRLF